MHGGDELRVADVVRTHAASRGDHVAVRHGEAALTYAQLDERSNRLANAVLALGAPPGSRIAYLGRSAPEVVELLFAASKIGAVLVPLNWRLSPPELGAVLQDSGAPVVVAAPPYLEVADGLAAARSVRVVAVGDDYEQMLGAHEATDPGGRGASGDVIVQMYTSGTTGVPKGVLTTHRNLAAAAETSPYWQFDEDSVSLTPLPMFHIGGIGWAFLGLWNGATTILVSEFVAADVLDTFERLRVTNAVLVPTMLQLLTGVPGAADRDYSALRSIAYGASPITTPVLKAALRTFGCSFFGVYGLTESTGGVVHLEPRDHDPDGPRAHLLRSAGKPLPWVELRVVDPDTGRDVDRNEVGEVLVRAPNVMAGYFNRPAETAAALVDGWLRTGDGGYLDDEGYLFLTDRIKDMIVSGGENVYPIEVEEALAQHPDVADVAVIGVPDERWGETVMALVIPRAGAEPRADELVAFARERVAGYKLPRVVELVDQLPRTASGKVLKRELRERYAAARA
ncbi:MAG: long-chain-fatty-acid--CoA ligase [Thermoleophilia bacterium]|nr:long-chain-fatty-acid--CoA ligase [Thermoleophilia bacterium]